MAEHKQEKEAAARAKAKAKAQQSQQGQQRKGVRHTSMMATSLDELHEANGSGSGSGSGNSSNLKVDLDAIAPSSSSTLNDAQEEGVRQLRGKKKSHRHSLSVLNSLAKVLSSLLSNRHASLGCNLELPLK